MKKYLIVLALLFAAARTPGAEMMSPPSAMPALRSAATDMMPGLKVGEKAPDFSLRNAAGEEIALQALLKKGKVALVFVRSADWCPFCRTQLQALQKDLPVIEAAGLQLVAISYDSPTTNIAAAAKLGLKFPLLSDPGSKVIDAYGIRNKEATGRAAGVPHPTVFILDSQGTIRAKLMRDGYRERPESAEIVLAAKSIM
ncbi:MAG: peroxiredoxin family protein [Opitutaceae bacterium]